MGAAPARPATRSGQLAGRTLGGRYEILDLIGSGGMGEVYRARDRDLDELIALKVIRPELQSLPGVIAGFRSEVKLARRVTHRNVARAFELGHDDGLTFYTMELVDGRSLTRRMASGRVLAGDAVEIALALCDALDAAHAAGVIHRDLKPDNVLIAVDGRVVLTDFGIAAVARDAAGGLQGTPRYIAPEQARGEPATPAADLYALGVILYELLTGGPAFTGSLLEILAAKERLVHLVLPAGDPRLVELIASVTHRDPAARPPTARALRRALAPFAPAQRARPHAEPSVLRAPPLLTVAVAAPRLVGSAAPYLGEALHQALLQRLAQWPRLRLVRAADVSPRSTLVELELADDAVVVHARDAFAAVTFTATCDVETLGRAVEGAARVIATLAGADLVPPSSTGPPPPVDAFARILQARFEVRRTRAALPAAIDACAAALAEAPGDARVLAALALCEAQQAFYAVAGGAALLAAATAHAGAALARDPGLAEAHLAQGHVELQRGFPVAAAASFRTAIARAPLSAEAHEWLGRLLLEAGFVTDGVARIEEAMALSPQIEGVRWELATARALDGDWDEVDRCVASLDERGVDSGVGRLARLAAWRGRPDLDARYLAQLRGATAAATFDRPFLLALFDVDVPWSARWPVIAAGVDDPRHASARIRAFVAQLAAEAAGRAGDVATCAAMLARATAAGLFDRHWLDRCPLLAGARSRPDVAGLRAIVGQRAEAIHDALYGEQPMSTAPTMVTTEADLPSATPHRPT
jgi:serine/threonine-protein kinase